MNDIPRELLDFIQPDDQFESILVVEGVDYLNDLRTKFPHAAIHVVTDDEDAADRFDDLNVTFHIMNYRDERLPFDEEFFDAIIGDLTLEVVTNPQDIAAGFASYIKQTGVWLTSFRNIRHWSVIDKLMNGHFGGIVSRLYAKSEFERLLYASFYKEVRMMPIVKAAPIDLLDRLITCGFENINDDLQTEFWLVRAARSTSEIALIKSMFTPEIRSQLSRLIHRIEYEIDVEQNVVAFWNLYDRAGLFADFVAEFISLTVIHRERFFEMLTSSSNRTEIAEIIAALDDVDDDLF